VRLAELYREQNRLDLADACGQQLEALRQAHGDATQL
jgi:hypothetical protein